MEKPTTVCVECEHKAGYWFMPRAVWSCWATDDDTITWDAVTGKKKVTAAPVVFCIERNTGNCPHYGAKEK
ncbi:unnamed protein product [marine sediment metagenome]|uniref:Uncharacterized protein n=1 Tax=marine sediment metagenome TaxID=412755 RepID=X0Y4Z1_9ZZZZ